MTTSFRYPPEPTCEILEELRAVQGELERWNRFNCPSATGYVVEDIPEGHPLKVAVATLQQRYGGALPKPALGYWRKLLKFAHNGDEDAEAEAEGLLKWVNGEIRAQSAHAQGDVNHADKAGAGEGARSEPDGGSHFKSPIGFLGGVALADALDVHATRRDAFIRQLERRRTSLGDDSWHEVRDPRPNSPKFLYRADSPKLRDLAAGYKRPKPA